MSNDNRLDAARFEARETFQPIARKQGWVYNKNQEREAINHGFGAGRDYAAFETSELSERLEAVEKENVKMKCALESISGTISADYAIRRANEVLAEIGVEGY